MANTVTAAKPGLSGGIYIAPLGTALPTDATTNLAEAFVTLGHVSADGVTNTNTPSTATIKDWNGDSVLVMYNEKEDTFKFKLLDASNGDMLKYIYGASNVKVETGTIEIAATNGELPGKVMVIDMILKNNKLKRIVIPCASISAIGDIVYKSSDAVAYDLTVSAVKATDVEGAELATHYEYMTV